MIMPREPQPGEKLNATWGRDVVRALKQIRPVGGPGMRVTCGPNGSTFSAISKGTTQDVSGDETMPLYPFRLGVGIESVTGSGGVTYRYHKVAVTPSVDINGVGYEVMNEAVDDDAKLGGLPLPATGSNLPWIWIKDENFNDITVETAGASGNTTDVWLHIDTENEKCVLSKSENYYKIRGEEPFATSEVFRVGKFDNPTGEPSVIGQYSLGSIIYKEEATHPFKIIWVNEGTEASPDLKLLVYLPRGAVQDDGNTSSTYVNIANTASSITDWYYVDESSSSPFASGQKIYLTGQYYWYTTAEVSHHVLYVKFLVTNDKSKYPEPPTSSGENIVHMENFVFVLSQIEDDETIYSFVKSAINFTHRPDIYREDAQSGGGSGGGTTVNVDDTRQDKTLPGIVGMGAVGATGVVNLKAFDAIDMESVATEGVSQGAAVTLLTYLAGDADVTTVNRSGAAVNLGRNLTSVLLNDDFDPDEDTIFSTADLANGEEGTITGKILSYDSDTGTIYTNEYIPANAVGISSDVEGVSYLTLDEYFNSHGFFRADLIGATGATGEGYTSLHALVFDGDEESPATTVTVKEGLAFLAPTGSTGPEYEAPTGEVGESSYAARSDHKHPICQEMGNATTYPEMTDTDNGTTGFPEASLDTSTWMPTGEDGYWENYCTRVIKVGAYRWFIFRERKVSRTGQVIYRGPEYCGFRARYA